MEKEKGNDRIESVEIYIFYEVTANAETGRKKPVGINNSGTILKRAKEARLNSKKATSMLAMYKVMRFNPVYFDFISWYICVLGSLSPCI